MVARRVDRLCQVVVGRDMWRRSFRAFTGAGNSGAVRVGSSCVACDIVVDWCWWFVDCLSFCATTPPSAGDHQWSPSVSSMPVLTQFWSSGSQPDMVSSWRSCHRRSSGSLSWLADSAYVSDSRSRLNPAEFAAPSVENCSPVSAMCDARVRRSRSVCRLKCALTVST